MDIDAIAEATAGYSGAELAAVCREAGLQAICRGLIGGSVAALADPQVFRRWLDALYRQDWVVYAKRPFGASS